jgi:hypothetical protein
MSERIFVDSNVLIYGHDSDAGARQSQAAQWLKQLWQSQNGRMSVQVLQEFYVNVTQKDPNSTGKTCGPRSCEELWIVGSLRDHSLHGRPSIGNQRDREDFVLGWNDCSCGRAEQSFGLVERGFESRANGHRDQDREPVCSVISTSSPIFL